MSLSSKRQVDKDSCSLEGVRVLVVEDTWHVAKALKVCAGARRNGCCWAGGDDSGRLGAWLPSTCPAVAVVDVNLKREMASGLIEELHDQGVRVVVISGYAIPPSLGAQSRGHPAKAVQRIRIVSRST